MKVVVKGLLAAVALSSVLLVGCDPYDCSVGGDCRGGKWEACCTNTQCEYRAPPDETFECDGTDCASAASRVVAYCR